MQVAGQWLGDILTGQGQTLLDLVDVRRMNLESYTAVYSCQLMGAKYGGHKLRILMGKLLYCSTYFDIFQTYDQEMLQS